MSDHPYFIAYRQPLRSLQRRMKETTLYSTALLAGIGMLLLGLALHTWKLVALGALIAGIGGWFGMLSNLKKH